jgi:hypothetical protein
MQENEQENERVQLSLAQFLFERHQALFCQINRKISYSCHLIRYEYLRGKPEVCKDPTKEYARMYTLAAELKAKLAACITSIDFLLLDPQDRPNGPTWLD